MSKLLVKIQQLIDENNQQQVYIEDIEKAYQKNNQEFEKMNNELYRLNE